MLSLSFPSGRMRRPLEQEVEEEVEATTAAEVCTMDTGVSWGADDEADDDEEMAEEIGVAAMEKYGGRELFLPATEKLEKEAIHQTTCHNWDV